MDRRSMFVNSSVRDSGGTDENFTVTIPDEIFINRPKSVKLIKACIPFSWYNIISTTESTTYANNKLKFTGSISGDHIIEVPPSNYDGLTLAAKVEELMNNATAANTYKVTFDEVSGFYTFTSTIETFTFDFTISNTLYERLGFANGSTPSSSALPNAIITSTQVAKLFVDLEIFVHSNLVGGTDNGVIPLTTETPKSNEILARISTCCACPGGFVDYCACPDEPFYLVTQSLFSKIKEDNDTTKRSIKFYLSFPSGFPLDLRGLRWSGQIVLEMNKTTF